MLAALICLLAVIAVTFQLNSARKKLQQFEPGAFNYVLQADSTLDKFSVTLDHYQTAWPSDQRAKIWEELSLRYDLLWGAFSVFKVPAPGQQEELAGTIELREEARVFLDEYESFFEFKAPLKIDEKTYSSVTRKVSSLQRKIHNMGTKYFVASADFGDDLSSRISDLYQYLIFSGVLMLLTGTLLIFQLFRFFNRADKLHQASVKAEVTLSKALDDVRSGKREIRARNNFLAAASHDLRQPLHAIGLFIGSLEARLSDPTSVDILSKVKSSTAALTQMLGSMLDISKLDAGVVNVCPTHFQLANVLDTIEVELQELAEQKQVDIRVDSDGANLYTDPVLLGRILRNLAENALVHSNSKTLVLDSTIQGDQVVLQVSDDGDGIPKAEQEIIFTEYYQIHSPERDRSKGLGLGLSIVYRLCRLLDIKLDLNSGLEKGTTFSLTIPVGQPAVQTKSDQFTRGKIIRHLKDAIVLVIEDEREVREGMKLILEEHYCQALLAESGDEALALINHQKIVPDILVVDYTLREGKTGTEAIESIRDELNQDVLAIIVTGDTSPDRVMEMAESGIAMLHKPVSPDELLQRIGDLLAEAASASNGAS